MAIEDILAKLDKKTRQRVQLAQEVNVDKLELASIGLTKALNGGFGRGRQSVIYGNKSAGKTSVCLQTIAEAQKRGETCAWVDAEQSFDPEWAERLGVDTSQLLISKAKSTDEFTADVCDFLKAEVDVVVVDSISALVPSTYFEKAEEMKSGLEGTKQIGTKSKEIGIAVNKFNYINSKTSLILITQVRNQFNTYGAALKADGGQALMFYSSTVVKLWSSASEREQKMQEVTYGNKIIQIPVGRPVTYTVEYNKIGPPNRVGEYDFYYDGDFVGVDQIGEIAMLAEKVGIVEKSGAWYYYDDEKFQGKSKFVTWLYENPAKAEELTRKCLG